jgi:hypothetical protein
VHSTPAFHRRPARRRLVVAATAAAVVAAAIASAAVAAPVAAAAASPVTQVRVLYRAVLTAEYFGPASAVCWKLTAAGERSFTAGGFSTCTAAFKAMQHTLRHRTPGVDDSGFTPAQWRAEVTTVMNHLRVTVHGARASAIGTQSGIPGRTTLVREAAGWRFSSYPPTIQP